MSDVLEEWCDSWLVIMRATAWGPSPSQMVCQPHIGGPNTPSSHQACRFLHQAEVNNRGACSSLLCTHGNIL